ncbi:DUF6431 domain-containing protein [Paenibacillus sp. FSL R7-0337]|uniref:DUF6431 domain-containing protein n=1 Tax=Paenibacillus sp. FSL R7-0337 TaxID=1926588 RepID=UPI0035576574
MHRQTRNYWYPGAEDPGCGGELRRLVIRRLWCGACRRIHHELPDLLLPYKRYDSQCIEQAVTEPGASVTTSAETSTLRHWKGWFRISPFTFFLLCRCWRLGSLALLLGSLKFRHTCCAFRPRLCSARTRMAVQTCPPRRKRPFVGAYPL